MTFWCFNCNTAVREDDLECKEGYTSIDGRTYRNTYEDEYFCPYCGSEFYTMEEAKECPICGEEMSPDRTICDECEEELTDRITSSIKDMVEAGDDEAFEAIRLWAMQKGI